MEFFRQEHWSRLPFPTPWDLPNPGIEPESPALQADYRLSHQGSPLIAAMQETGVQPLGQEDPLEK